MADAAFGSEPGGPDVICGYIARLTLSIGTDDVVAAAGKAGRQSQPLYVADLANSGRPRGDAAMASTRIAARCRIAALQTSPNPAFEIGDSLLAQALSGPFRPPSLRLTPDLSDFNLDNVHLRPTSWPCPLVQGSFASLLDG